MTKRACVMGYQIPYSRSPMIHGHWLRELGIDGEYGLKDLSPEAFQDFVTHLTGAPHVRNVRTSLVLHNSKYEAAVPLELKVPG